MFLSTFSLRSLNISSYSLPRSSDFGLAQPLRCLPLKLFSPYFDTRLMPRQSKWFIKDSLSKHASFIFSIIVPLKFIFNLIIISRFFLLFHMQFHHTLTVFLLNIFQKFTKKIKHLGERLCKSYEHYLCEAISTRTEAHIKRSIHKANSLSTGKVTIGFALM